MKFIKIILVTTLFTTAVACSKQLDSLLENPNSPSLSTADVDLLLNTVQLSFSYLFDDASNFGGALTRQQTWYGPTYSSAYNPGSFNGLWNTGYTSILKNANALIPLAQAQKRYTASGMAKFMKAYTITLLVDAFGDIPYSEAVLGVANPNPKTDASAKIYEQAILLYDDAIKDFSTAGAAPANDVFYGGNTAKWITASNTMKLKLLMQTRKVDATANAKIAALITTGNLIKTISGDLNFKYGTNITSPDSRHPDYAGNYGPNGAGEYLGDWFMWAVAAEKSGSVTAVNPRGPTVDPRQRYYFYRQNTNSANVNEVTLFCSTNLQRPPNYTAEMPYCYVGAGYWGRDHGDNGGTPPDGQFKTTWGVYPAGGEVDQNQAAGVKLEMGGKGAGILPIWNSEFTYFVHAEAAIVGIIPGGAAQAKTFLTAALKASIAKVTGFAATVGVSVSATFAPTTATIDNYVSLVMAQYDAAATNEDKLAVIMKEYYLALWGNGWEAYNNYRLTGYPKNMQPTVFATNPGLFVRLFQYPQDYVGRNLNAPKQRALGTAVSKAFWDNNPDNFIK